MKNLIWLWDLIYYLCFQGKELRVMVRDITCWLQLGWSSLIVNTLRSSELLVTGSNQIEACHSGNFCLTLRLVGLLIWKCWSFMILVFIWFLLSMRRLRPEICASLLAALKQELRAIKQVWRSLTFTPRKPYVSSVLNVRD